jgi:hypothetical protein
MSEIFNVAHERLDFSFCQVALEGFHLGALAFGDSARNAGTHLVAAKEKTHAHAKGAKAAHALALPFRWRVAIEPWQNEQAASQISAARWLSGVCTCADAQPNNKTSGTARKYFMLFFP